ncbi:MAG: hypothetical protein ABSG15_03645 [FCB group bacterium]|jgi:hypothetical protein
MKYLLILIVILISPVFCFSQNNIENDFLLLKIRKQLPVGWKMELTTNNLFITRKDSIWVIFTNHINEPIAKKKLSQKEIKKRFMKYGRKIIYRINYKLEPRWLPAKIIQAKKEISVQISQLPKKYKIEALKDKFLSSKGEDFYVGHTQEEKDSITKFYKEKGELETILITKIPYLNSENYSLIPVREIGWDDDLTDKWPPESSIEFSKVWELVEDICGIRQ